MIQITTTDKILNLVQKGREKAKKTKRSYYVIRVDGIPCLRCSKWIREHIGNKDIEYVVACEEDHIVQYLNIVNGHCSL